MMDNLAGLINMAMLLSRAANSNSLGLARSSRYGVKPFAIRHMTEHEHNPRFTHLDPAELAQALGLTEHTVLFVQVPGRAEARCSTVRSLTRAAGEAAEHFHLVRTVR